MTLVMTLLARDEADVIESWLSFHLNAGADFVVATDNRSEDGTTEVLERFAREGHVHLIREDGEDLRQNEWVTRMARLAATDFGADWVINSDADEFWWPRGASLAQCSRRFRRATGRSARSCGRSLRGPTRKTPSPSGSPCASPRSRRSTTPRRSSSPSARSSIAATPRSRSRGATMRSIDSPFAPLRGWFPVEVLHFPLRSVAQCEHKARLQGNAWKHIDRTPTAYHAQMFEALEAGTIADYYEAQVVSDAEVERGVGVGSARRRHAAARRATAARHASETPLEFPTPTLVDEATYAVEAAVLGEADVVRLQRRLDTLERRLATVEQGLPNRVYRKLVGPAKRVLAGTADGRLQVRPALDGRRRGRTITTCGLTPERVVGVELRRLEVGGRESVEEPGAASTFP